MKYSQQEAKKIIEKLVERFNQQDKNEINEKVARTEFIDKFFEALNWDVRNTNERNLTEKFVYEEYEVFVEGNTKKVDYAFCKDEGGKENKVFFVEAKSPKDQIEKNMEYAFQTRNYGWNANMYISVLTNFEEFAIYSTLAGEPKITDPASKNRIDYFRHTQFVERFDEIWEVFEFHNVQEGSIRQYFYQNSVAFDEKGADTVDNTLLKLIESWRLMIAKGIVGSSQNDKILVSNKDFLLNYSVQKIIDRIIFLRFIEDRGLEKYGTLRDAAENYQQLFQLFEYADKKYNSGLFHFSDKLNRGIPDEITPKLYISKERLKDIIEPLYIANPFNFSIIPVFVLGSVYERFLGKEVSIEKNKIVVSEKLAVRKAGGVYYTPEYIAKYIVKNSLPTNKKNIKILDPSCGSGCFLVTAFQFMLSYHEKEKRDYLTLQERKQILLDHIYGVDLDDQAVEIAKLSLLLKVLEGIKKDEVEKLKEGEYVLPDLYKNIRCGNSLIDDETVAGKKAFVWKEEFAEVFDSGKEVFKEDGFDVVVGNPPYVQLQKDKEGSVIYSHFYTYSPTGDIYCLFYEQALNLLKPNGTVGYITSNKWMRANYGEKLRYLFSQNNPKILLDFSGVKIFSDATVDCNILILQKKQNQNKTKALNVDKKEIEKLLKNKTLNQKLKEMQRGSLFKEDALPTLDLSEYVSKNKPSICKFNSADSWIIMDEIETQIKAKIETVGTPLKDWDIKINRGVTIGLNDAFIIDEDKRAELISQDPKSEKIIVPVLRGRDIKRYSYDWAGLYLINTHNGIKNKDIPPIDVDYYPAIKKHLEKNYLQLLKRQDQGDTPYNLRNCVFIEDFEKNKIIWSDISTGPNFVYDDKGFFLTNTAYIMPDAPYFFLGVLNSKLIGWFFTKTASILGSKGTRYIKQYVEMIPIPKPTKRIEQRIEKLLDKKDYDKIDEIVYELYGLSEEEIKYVKDKK